MSLRRRIGLIAAASVAAAVLIAVLVCYFVVRDQLRGQVDTALREQADGRRSAPSSSLRDSRDPRQRGRAGAVHPDRARRADHVPVARAGQRRDPGQRARAPDRGDARRGSYMTDVHVGDNHLRVLTFPVRVPIDGVTIPAALQLARPLNGVDAILSNLRLVLFLVFLGGIALAAGLGRLAARRALAPLAEVAQAAQHIGETDDLSNRIRVHADDEVGQLATRFNSMLDRLEGSRAELDESMRAQRQLVADASHELRTPVTSLRTNIEVLLEGGELDPEDRRRLLADVVEQSEELTALVTDLIELARGDEPGYATEDVRLDGIAAESIARSHRNAPQIQIESHLQPVTLDGVPARLERAINNLLDNAARHSPPGGIDRGHGRRRGRHRPRSRPGRRRAGSPVRVRPLLPRHQLPRPAGQRARARDRAPGHRAARRHAPRSQMRPTAAPCSRSTCRSSPPRTRTSTALPARRRTL